VIELLLITLRSLVCLVSAVFVSINNLYIAGFVINILSFDFLSLQTLLLKLGLLLIIHLVHIHILLFDIQVTVQRSP